jgi:peptide deformylase
MVRSIIQTPNVRLKLRSKEVDTLCVPLQAVQDLKDTFASYAGCIGLAAPQIGIESRIIVVDVSRSRCDTYLMINPVIEKWSEELSVIEDGCMSVELGRKFITTRRPKRMTVSWFDVYSSRYLRQKFSGLIAACIHHEVDHLNGVMMMERAYGNNCRATSALDSESLPEVRLPVD